MNYNSQNLSLSPKKVIKKSLREISLIFSLIFLYLFFGFSRQELSDVLVNITILLLVVTGINIFFEYLYYKTYYYNFTDERAEIRKGVISRSIGNVEYSKIQNVYVDQDFWDRIFGLYDVHFETAGEKSGIYSHVDGLNKTNADILLRFLLDKTRR